MKNKFGFVLVKTQLGKYRSVCTFNEKFGFSKLYLVNPKLNFPNHKTKATSVGAYDIINKAKVFNDVEKTLKHFNLVIAQVRKKRDINRNIFHYKISKI